MADLRLLLDLLGDEPLEELEPAMVAGGPADLGGPVELTGDRPFGLEGPPGGLERGCEPGRRGLERRQVEIDVVVDEEVDDLLGVLGFLDRLLAEELAPAIEALAFEVDGDREVQRMRGELVPDLGDEQLAEVGTEHGGAPGIGRGPRAAETDAHDRIPAAVSDGEVA